jgi:hypothetical protein
MRYTKIKKAQKKRSSCSVSPDLIAGNRFEEIVTILTEKSELKNQDRYLYGYSLLRTQRKLESLITLWPLAKSYPLLQKDCASIAAHVFKDENLLSSVQLSEEDLYILFLVVKNLIPQSQVCNTLKQRFFNFLWQQKNYEKLERVLKSTKEEFSGILIENLSKLAFFQAEKKLIGNIPAFIGHILTGGACLILRNQVYHGDGDQGDIADKICSLAKEIKYRFSQLEIKNNQTLAWDKSLFENFVDYEASILTQVLQLLVKNGVLHLDIIPTPSYLMAHDSATRRVSQHFLPWLASKHEGLFEMYNADTYHAVFWAISGKELSGVNKILKTGHFNKFHPYLRLAIMFRATNIEKSSLKRSVQICDIENLNETISLFKMIAIKTVMAMLNEASKIKLSTAFWQMLSEFYPVLQDPELKNSLITKLIYILHKEYEGLVSLNFGTIKNIAYQMNDDEFKKQVEVLSSRQQACSQFLLNLKDEKKSKYSITRIKNKQTLCAHLTLVADSCCLLYAELSVDFFLHIKSLVENKKINKIVPLGDLIDCDFECDCVRCKMDLYRYKILAIGEKLNLPVVHLPDVHFYSNLQMISETKTFSSVLSQTDPFEILDVSLDDPKQIIMQKVMKLIQQSPGQMAIFRQAQNELFHPTKRFLHHYFRYFAYENNTVEPKADPLPMPAHSSVHEIPFRHEFLNAD